MGPSRRSNWLDQWRLLLAALVIFSHSFQFLRGGRDPLTALGVPTDLGKVAVAGFLVLSGYVISQAWERAGSWVEYLRNRLLRIAPAFWAASSLSVLAALLVGGSAEWSKLPLDLLSLGQPHARFPTPTNYEANGALWTIQLEFACYLLAPLLTIRRSVLAISWLCAAGMVLFLAPHVPMVAKWWLRGVLMFLSGAAYWRFRLSLNRWALAASLILLPLALHNNWTWQIGLAVFGGYALLSLGLLKRAAFAWTDVSYGVYLYGWPVQKLLVMAGVSAPWTLFLVAMAISLTAGAASWLLVERRAMRLKATFPVSGSWPAAAGSATYLNH